MKDIQVTDQQLVVLAQEMLKQAQDDESLLKDVYELLKQRFTEKTVPHWTDGEIALDFYGRPFSSGSTGGMHFYMGARTLEEAQHAHKLWRAVKDIELEGGQHVRGRGYVSLPEDDPKLMKAKQKYTEYTERLAARVDKDYPFKPTTSTPTVES
jgi:hypothetical protein